MVAPHSTVNPNFDLVVDNGLNIPEMKHQSAQRHQERQMPSAIATTQKTKGSRCRVPARGRPAPIIET
jgi:hypothetical protein